MRVREMAAQIKAGLEREWGAWEVQVLERMKSVTDKVRRCVWGGWGKEEGEGEGRGVLFSSKPPKTATPMHKFYSHSCGGGPGGRGGWGGLR